MNFNCYESQIWLRCSLTSIIDSTSTKWSRNNNSNDSVDIAFMNSHKKSITSKNSVTSLDFVSQRWTFGSCPLLKRVRQSDMFFQAAFPLIDALVGWYDGVARREHVELHEVRRWTSPWTSVESPLQGRGQSLKTQPLPDRQNKTDDRGKTNVNISWLWWQMRWSTTTALSDELHNPRRFISSNGYTTWSSSWWHLKQLIIELRANIICWKECKQPRNTSQHLIHFHHIVMWIYFLSMQFMRTLHHQYKSSLEMIFT